MPADSSRDIDDPDRAVDDSPIVWLDRSEAFSSLTATEIIVYEYLAEEGPARSTTVQYCVPLSDRSIRRALSSLCADGLAESRPDPNSPNSSIVSLAD
jgi:DNA-binding MarR family transcriptional regulator